MDIRWVHGLCRCTRGPSGPNKLATTTNQLQQLNGIPAGLTRSSDWSSGCTREATELFCCSPS